MPPPAPPQPPQPSRPGTPSPSRRRTSPRRPGPARNARRDGTGPPSDLYVDYPRNPQPFPFWTAEVAIPANSPDVRPRPGQPGNHQPAGGCRWCARRHQRRLLRPGPKGRPPRRATTRQGRQGAQLALDGVNRVPGLIRNCGGTGDAPSVLRHDCTCTDPDEVIAFTEDFGSATPSGRGLEVVLDNQGTVTAVNAPGARP